MIDPKSKWYQFMPIHHQGFRNMFSYWIPICLRYQKQQDNWTYSIYDLIVMQVLIVKE